MNFLEKFFLGSNEELEKSQKALREAQQGLAEALKKRDEAQESLLNINKEIEALRKDKLRKLEEARDKNEKLKEDLER